MSSVKYLRRTTFLSLFAYLYGEPEYTINRLAKTSLIQFTDAELPLNFEKSIGEQIRGFKESKQLIGMDDYYNALFASVKNDKFFDTMFLESNFQNKLGGECYIFSRGNDKYIVFRGSDTPIDILIDLTIETVPLLIGDVLTDKKIRIHRGFLEQMKNYNFIQQITKAVHAKDGMNLYIIGHSLGSASGLILSYYMHHAYKTIDISINCSSVGGPVVGNSAWVKSFNDIFCNGNKKRRFDRLINERDIIPNIHILAFNIFDMLPILKRLTKQIPPPPSSSKFILFRYFNKSTYEYQHVGHETWINRYETFDLFCDTWVAEEPELIRVQNATHTFVTPRISDVLDIAYNHMIDYQKWLSSMKNISNDHKRI